MPELHILANHLLADRAAVAAISALLHPTSSSTAKAVADYIEELERQLDSDGLHEERSPGYHLIALHDLKRTIAAVEIAGLSDAARRLSPFETSMVAAMRRLLHPDGTMPMFHDSPALASPSSSDLDIRPFRDDVSVDLSASGLCALQHDRGGSPVRLVADFGTPRPAHQPGHQHAAPFAFELWWGGLWITSAGVSTYETGERRLFERGAAAHACVRVGGREPAEIWSAFRMGRGYEVSERRFEHSGSRVSISARHDGFAPASQRRTMTLDRSLAQLTIRDQIAGAGTETIESFLPLAPGVHASVSSQTVTLRCAERVVEVVVAGARVEMRPFDVALRFGERQASHVIVMTATGDGVITMNFSFRSSV